MKTLAAAKFSLKNPLISFLQISKTTTHMLQILAQLTTNDLVTDPFTLSQLLMSLTSPNTLNMDHAERLFNQIYQPNTYMHNTMIRGYTQSSDPQKALSFYVNMKRKGLLVDNYTYPFVLKACGVLMGLVEGTEIHGEVVKMGFLCDVFVVNGLIGMYSKCGHMGCARSVFEGSEIKDLVSWNLVLRGFEECGEMGKAREDLVSWNSMIDGYAKIGDLVAAQQLFNEMPERNVFSWSIMIDGYAQHGNPKEALYLFREMLCQGVRPDVISVMGAISACAQVGALDLGKWIHVFMKRSRITMDMIVQTALIDMYMKCGSLDEARRIFYSMTKKNVISYNVMIAGLGMNGFGEEALKCFAQMETEGIPKDDLIFLGVLIACSHSGLATEGYRIFQSMKRHCGIEPKLEHYSCLVDLLSRAGELEQALNIVESMPMKPNLALWGTLLLACRNHQNVTLAEVVVEGLVELKADDCGVYVLLSNIYADAGMWEHALRIQKMMRKRKIKKETGRSVIEIDGNIKEFVSGEIFDVQSEKLELVIQSFVKTTIER
ncbi:hypothetical protein KPL71_004379 [Citrus sinensis]|uniref:Uncharacterized protein n=1 Tax=Citrus sinensis TaxID=2711 RepID=A0ACB8N559_CITSI|nr:hypothetical protein KPL71_004379 [Citrus sinensis]